MASNNTLLKSMNREQRLAFGIVFGAIGSALLASVFVALSPTMKLDRPEPVRAATPAMHRADLAIDVEAAVATAATAAARADGVAAEAEKIATQARAGRRGPTFARLSLPGGKSFEGDANNGAPEGIGIMRGGDIAFAAGFFVGGVRSGPGVDCAKADCTGASYVGDFRANAPTGAARITFADGAVYRGDVRDGAPDGFGELVRADGSRYSGAFLKGRRDGHGAETPAAGPPQRGYWQADQLSESAPS
jgi:hypothetical protein